MDVRIRQLRLLQIPIEEGMGTNGAREVPEYRVETPYQRFALGLPAGRPDRDATELVTEERVDASVGGAP